MHSAHRILVVGSGGREHALAWRLASDPGVEHLIVAPGNDGIARRCACAPVRETESEALLALCASERINLVVIGPEAPLAAGLADALTAAGLAVFGPSRAAARLESSKWAAKQIMLEAGVPTARGRRLENLRDALAALDECSPPWVIKADGLAAGKGVCVTTSRGEAEEFIRECVMSGRFGDAGRTVLLEEHLEGEEASVIAVCDGERFVLLPAARDFKRAHDGDRGSNTGGMGAIAPTPAVTAAIEAEVARRIIAPVLAVLRRQGTPYRGALYAGLMLTATGLSVVEFNARFGDPETQAVLPLLGGSLAALLAGAAAGHLDPGTIERRGGAAVSVALVDRRYPEANEGGTITGLDALMDRDDLMVFHAGTARAEQGWVIRGGRAVHVAARAATLEQARAVVYAAIDTLGGSGWRVRRDIGALPATVRSGR